MISREANTCSFTSAVVDSLRARAKPLAEAHEELQGKQEEEEAEEGEDEEEEEDEEEDDEVVVVVVVVASSESS